MPQAAKVYARVFDFTMPEGVPDGTLRFTVEWRRLTGGRESGKVAFTINGIVNDGRLRDDLRELLADYLTERFAPEVFRPRDIVGYSV